MPESSQPRNAGPDSVTLVRRAQAGELEAFDRLFERYYGPVKHIVRVRIGPEIRASHESDDVLHEALIEAIRAFDRFEIREDAGLIDWLAKIVENRVKAMVRHGRAAKRDRDAEIALDHIRSSISTGNLRLDLEANSPSPEEQADQHEQISILGRCLEQLEPKFRQVIMLRLYESLSWEEVANKIGAASPDSARMLYSKARIALSQRVKRFQDDDPEV